MKVHVKGNPGSGNHYTEVKVINVENNFSGVNEVTIVKNADGTKTVKASGSGAPAPTSHAAPASVDNTQALKEAVRRDILAYVAKLLPLIAYQWKDKYMALWADILLIPEVDAVVFKKGHQHDTSFNRREVLHIICYLGKHAAGGVGIFEERYVATRVAQMLGDGFVSRTRPELGFNTTKPIQIAIDKLMNSKTYLLKE